MTLCDKMKILKKIDKGLKKKRFGIAASTLATILKIKSLLPSRIPILVQREKARGCENTRTYKKKCLSGLKE